MDTHFEASWSKMYNFWIIILLLTGRLHMVECWHDLSNTQFHCWPYTASAANPTTYPSCPGVSVDWVEAPPNAIQAEGSMNVSYELRLDTAFWAWAVSEDVFTTADAGNGITNASVAEQWCWDTVCPSDVALAIAENCCIHHVNVHSCPIAETDGGLCGPWIPPQGAIFTHSAVLVGNTQTTVWASKVEGLYTVGHTSIIAHFKIGNMHIALEKEIDVLPSTVCGDDVCDSEEESCDTCPTDCGRCPLAVWVYIIIAVISFIIVTAFCILIIYFRYKQNKMLWDESWIVNFDDVCTEPVADTQVSRLSIESEKSHLSTTRWVATKKALYNGRSVAVRCIMRSEFSLTKAIRREVKQVRLLDHVNLCKFVGGSTDWPHVAILMEHCPKGGLNKVLSDLQVPLNWGFRFSFATDIARGMEYLHSNRIFHGRLKARNCLVDDRWTIKVTDYGLTEYRSAPDAAVVQERDTASVYLAPEILVSDSPVATAEGDTYAFSILLIEIAQRIDVEKVDIEYMHSRPKLPDLEKSSDGQKDSLCPCPLEYVDLIARCWADYPSERPSFEQIRKILWRINPDKRNPVDMMMAMMEKYSKHLEVLVAERTADLEIEKQKTDRLLYSMLPRAVADNLRQGKTTEAEQFGTCTIYFSDVVGFTTLCSDSTAMQVVGLLNQLYTCFDSIIERYDVYKVETIGDAYMVVSGVPRVNGDNHAREIACLAIDLVAAAKVFVIPHRPDEKLRIRVGLHTGPVCAGVVGLKMPRYCLFGDTVNTASRMESNGEAYKIHVSDVTYQLLIVHFNGFSFERRGTIPIKGKGEMTTWWLTGREATPQSEVVTVDTPGTVQSERPSFPPSTLAVPTRADELRSSGSIEVNLHRTNDSLSNLAGEIDGDYEIFAVGDGEYINNHYQLSTGGTTFHLDSDSSAGDQSMSSELDFKSTVPVVHHTRKNVVREATRNGSSNKSVKAKLAQGHRIYQSEEALDSHNGGETWKEDQEFPSGSRRVSMPASSSTSQTKVNKRQQRPVKSAVKGPRAVGLQRQPSGNLNINKSVYSTDLDAMRKSNDSILKKSVEGGPKRLPPIVKS